MTDANKYYLDKREAEQEEYDFKDEYEDIAADNVRLEADLTYWKADSAAAWDKCEENRLKLAKAVEFIEDLTGCEWPYCEDAKRVLAELKGQDDE